ncbi:MAG: TrkH family potassium uptake protein [Traorella sp.]
MNKKIILHVLRQLLKMEGLLMLLPFITGIIYQEKEAFVYLFVAILVFVLGLICGFKKSNNKTIYAKEGFVIVALTWILFSLFGALPFWISQEIPSYIDAFFEIVSGFTTTGSSILNNIEALSHASLFWRSFSHWIGGMGILVFVIMFLTDTGGTTVQILKAEMPGPIVGKLVSKVKMTSKLLYRIYAVLTVVEVVLLMMGGMPFFDSLLNAFGTAGTGGYAIKNASIAFYDNAYFDAVITVFMILFGINFNLLYFILIGKVGSVFRSEELKWYLGIIFTAIVAITINISSLYSSILQAFRYSSFTVASIITTTGFITANYGEWPLFSQIILMMLMFVGACAGSTGGGIKISRIAIYCKNAFAELKRMLHPHSVVSVRFEGKYLDKTVMNNIHVYLVFYSLIFGFSLLLISMQSIDFTSAFSAVATCMNNVGPGFGIVGPVGNFSSLSNFSKLVLCFDMMVGRLEIFPILMLFYPRLWKKLG